MKVYFLAVKDRQKKKTEIFAFTTKKERAESIRWLKAQNTMEYATTESHINL